MNLLFWKRKEGKTEDMLRKFEEEIKELKKENEQIKKEIEGQKERLHTLEEANIKLSEAIKKLAEAFILERKIADNENESSKELEKEIIEIMRRENRPIRAREISELTGKTREHVSRVLKNMAKKGILERERKGKIFFYTIKEEKTT